MNYIRTLLQNVGLAQKDSSSEVRNDWYQHYHHLGFLSKMVYLFFTKIYKVTNDVIKKTVAFKEMLYKFDSPGLFVNTYLKKFAPIINWTKKIVKKNGNCFSNRLKKIIIRDNEKDKNTIPIISANPATAWLKNPILFNANSSVKTKSWNE